MVSIRLKVRIVQLFIEDCHLEFLGIGCAEYNCSGMMYYTIALFLKVGEGKVVRVLWYTDAFVLRIGQRSHDFAFGLEKRASILNHSIATSVSAVPIRLTGYSCKSVKGRWELGRNYRFLEFSWHLRLLYFYRPCTATLMWRIAPPRLGAGEPSATLVVVLP
jgi:hypothetical protein